MWHHVEVSPLACNDALEDLLQCLPELPQLLFAVPVFPSLLDVSDDLLDWCTISKLLPNVFHESIDGALCTKVKEIEVW